MLSFPISSSISQSELLSRVDALNSDPSTHGILVQMPLGLDPGADPVDADAVTDRVDAAKDVDGLCSLNRARIGETAKGGERGFLPCTPQGCMELIRRTGVEVMKTFRVFSKSKREEEEREGERVREFNEINEEGQKE